MADIFDRIAAAIQAKNSGDNPAYDAHLAALDQEYSTLQGSQAGEASNIAALQTGLQKIADAVNPATAGTSTTTATGASDGTATGTGAATTGTDTGGTTTTTTTTGDQSGAAAADPNAPAAA